MLIIVNRERIKFFLVFLLTFLASLGTVVYGYRFSAYYFHDLLFQIPIGVLLAIAGAVANIFLGAFSLLRINQGPVKYPYSMLILVVCIFSAIPTGCICFFGYQAIIPIQINILLSSIITIVNTAINYTAIQYFIRDILLASRNKNKSASTELQNTIVGGLGYLIGMLVALAPFLATTEGANDILLYYHLNNFYENNVGIIVGILSFIPLACLYSHTNKAVLINFYNFMLRPGKKNTHFNLLFVAIVFFCFLSGASLAQIMRDFFSPDRNIPALFKMEFMQIIAANFLVPLAWISNAVTTFYCINALLVNKSV